MENAELLADLGRYDKALEVLQGIVEKRPNDVEAHLMMGRVCLELDDFEGADDAFGNAVAVGGWEAVSRMDEIVIGHYKSIFPVAYPHNGGDDGRVFEVAGEALNLLSKDEMRIDAFNFSLENLIVRDTQDAQNYFDLWTLFGEELNIGADVLAPDLYLATVRLARRAAECGECKATAYELVRWMSLEDEPPFNEILADYSEDVERTKVTMADLRTLGTALEAFAIDNGVYPWANDLSSVVPLIEPMYLRSAPMSDGWGTEFILRSDGRSYLLVSAASDMKFEDAYNDTSPPFAGPVLCCDRDITYSNGTFIQFPKGVLRW